MTFFRRFFLIFLLTPLAPAAQWIRVRSANVEIYTTAGEKKGREAALYFEQVRSLFVGLNVKRATHGAPVRIIAFQSDKEYQPYQPNRVADAFYQPGYDHDYIVMRSISGEDFPLALHEYMHLVIARSGWRIPVWLNEGIAEIYSTLKPAGKKLEIGSLIPGAMQTLAHAKLVPLPVLMAVDQRSPLYSESDRANIFYAESWALTHMLMMTETYRPAFAEFIDSLQSGAGTDAAFERAYGKSIGQIQTDLDRYIHGNNFYAGFFDTQLDKAAEKPVVEAADPVETRLALAEVLANLGKVAEARERYEALAKENPSCAPAFAAAGRLALAAGDQVAARTHFARAIELQVPDSRIYFNYALLLHTANADDPSVLGLLQKAVQLDANNGEAREFLATRYASANDFPRALEQLRSVRTVKPDGAHQYFQLLAYVHLQLGNQSEARTAAQRALQTAATPAQTKEASRLLDLVDRR